MTTFKRFKLLVLLVAALMIAVAVVGCGGKSEEKVNTKEGQNGGEIKGTVKVAGSTSVQPLTEELAEAFMKKNQDITVSVQGGGSSAGVESANKGAAQIGTSSREIKPEEKGYGLQEIIIAKDGIAVIVNSGNQVTALTKDQIKKIFAGEVTDWSEVGGKKAPITVVIREEGSGTRGAFQEMVLGTGVKFINNAIVQSSTGAIKTSVTKDINAIGFISSGSVDSAVKAVSVDGILPSEATVLDGSYKISRPFLFLTKGEPDPAARAFINYVLSAEGQKIVSEKFVKVK
ncbi:MAG: phosphate ABC transporter substrate-binding protein [Eubacteriales bacterium]